MRSAIAANGAAVKDYLLFVGTYTTRDSKGIYAYRFDVVTGATTSLGLAAQAANPSFLAVHPSQRFLYAVNELAEYRGAVSGAITSFSIDHATGHLSSMNQVATRGANPCYISLDKSGKHVLVANYNGGSIAIFPIGQDGRLGDATAVVQHAGVGKNRERQEGPHAHWIETTADNRFAIVADLGLDGLLVYRFDAEKGSLTPNSPLFTSLDAGAGPRHIAFHPGGGFAYVINELASTITSLSWVPADGVLQPLRTVSTLPPAFGGANDAAQIHVHPTGRYLFASNRGHNSIASFSIAQKTGALKLVDHFSTQGKTPRNFEIDPTGTRLLVTNQESGNIVIFRIDAETGGLIPTGQILQVPSPVCLRFVAAN